MKKNKNKRKKAGKKKRNKQFDKVVKYIKNNKLFFLIIFALVFSLGLLVINNLPVTTISNQGLKLLNKYEYPTYLLTEDNCMEPYDVGDGVITFGPGITYPNIESGIDDINAELNTNYTIANSCIKQKDLSKMQKKVISEYEQIVINVEIANNYQFNQQQFDGLVLLAYNSPNIFKNEEFLAVITNPNSSYDQYVVAADNYYQQLSGYFTTFGSGWYNRIIDSAQLYYEGDYQFQNN